MREGDATEDGRVWMYSFDLLEWMRGSLVEDGFHCVAAFRVAMSHGVDEDKPYWLKTLSLLPIKAFLFNLQGSRGSPLQTWGSIYLTRCVNTGNLLTVLCNPLSFQSPSVRSTISSPSCASLTAKYEQKVLVSQPSFYVAADNPARGCSLCWNRAMYRSGPTMILLKVDERCSVCCKGG